MKSILRSSIVQGMLATLIWAYMALIGRTSHWHVEGLDRAMEYWESERGMIAAAWHSRILLLPTGYTRFVRKRAKSGNKLGILISLSRDGAFVARAAEMLGVQVIRGSAGNKKKKDKNKGGITAIKEAGEMLENGGAVCITVDGPRGPRQRVSPGAILLAQRKGVPILTYALAASPAKRLNSWDHFVLPMPFGKGALVIGEIIEAPRGMDVDTLRLRVEGALNAATERAEMLVGGEYLPPDPILGAEELPKAAE